MTDRYVPVAYVRDRAEALVITLRFFLRARTPTLAARLARMTDKRGIAAALDAEYRDFFRNFYVGDPDQAAPTNSSRDARRPFRRPPNR